MIRHLPAVHELQHRGVNHLAHHQVGLALGVVAREHLSVNVGGLCWPVRLNLGDGGGLAPKGMVDEVFLR